MYSTQTACIHTVEYWVYCMWLVFCLGVLNGKTDKDKRKRFVGLTAVAACLCLLACSTDWVKTNLHCCAEHMHTFDRKENSPISEAMLLLAAGCCCCLLYWAHICNAYFMVRLRFQFEQCVHFGAKRKQSQMLGFLAAFPSIQFISQHHWVYSVLVIALCITYFYLIPFCVYFSLSLSFSIHWLGLQ